MRIRRSGDNPFDVSTKDTVADPQHWQEFERLKAQKDSLAEKHDKAMLEAGRAVERSATKALIEKAVAAERERWQELWELSLGFAPYTTEDCKAMLSAVEAYRVAAAPPSEAFEVSGQLKNIQEMLAVVAEREACAQIAEYYFEMVKYGRGDANDIADAIRARGNYAIEVEKVEMTEAQRQSLYTTATKIGD